MITAFSAMSQTFVNVDSANKINGKPYYVLPKTCFQIQVLTQTSTLSQGSYREPIKDSAIIQHLKLKYGFDIEKYNKVYNINPKSKKVRTTEIMTDSIKITTLPMADLTKIYTADASSKWYKTQSQNFKFGTDGLLKSGETTVENKLFDIITKTISSVASIASATKGSNLMSTPTGIPDELKAKLKDLDDILREYDKLTIQTDLAIYKELKSGIDKKYNAAFSALFYGEKKETKKHTSYYCPKSDIKVPITIKLFQLSGDTLHFNNEYGSQIFGADIKSAKIVDSAEYFQIVFEDFNENISDLVDDQRSKSGGLAYNLPRKVSYKLQKRLVNGNPVSLQSEYVKVAQWGVVGRINTHKKNKLSYTLDPNTGELVEITVASNAITTDQVGSATTAITDVINAAKPADPDDELEKTVKRLENQKKLRELMQESVEN